MSRYKPQRLTNGAVLSSGLDLRPRGTSAPLQPKKGPYRAVVLNSYVPDDDDSLRGLVECDVILVRSNIRLPRVPVMQQHHGFNDAAPWVPRPTTSTIDGQPIEVSTSYNEYNGDLVLVDFIEGDSEAPIVLYGALPHPRSRRKVVRGNGWAEGDTSSRGTPQSDERYLHHRGTEVRVNRAGDVLIDTVGAYGADDTEAPASSGGQVRVRLKNGQRFTIECDGTDVLEVFKDDTGVHVDIGEGAAQKMVLGDVLKTLYSALTVPTAFGPSGTPLNAASFDTCLSAQHRIKE